MNTPPYWFRELKQFTSAWTDLRLNVEDLCDLQDEIQRDPIAFPVIAGTGGLRKMRFASRRSNKGKRGSLRVCYAFFARSSAIVLFSVYSKSDMDDLTPEDKKLIKRLINEFEHEFERRFGNEPETEKAHRR